MPVKTILVPVDGTNSSGRCLEAAIHVAKMHNAHVEVFHVRSDPKDAVPLLGEGMSGAMIEEMIDLADKEAGDRSGRARKLYDDALKAHGLPEVDKPQLCSGPAASWIEVVGREDEAVAVRARLADLSVIARPTPEGDFPSSMTLNAALFETGKTMAISWNGSAESARAVAAGIVYLTLADTVLAMAVHSARTPPMAARGLGEYLAWHGITAVAEPIEPGGYTVGQVVLGFCAEHGVDMLVMGAYTHSRVRQLILGGVTRHVLENAQIPLLMAR